MHTTQKTFIPELFPSANRFFILDSLFDINTFDRTSIYRFFDIKTLIFKKLSNFESTAHIANLKFLLKFETQIPSSTYNDKLPGAS